MDYKLIQVTPYSPALGAEVRGINLADSVNEAQFAETKDAYLKYQVFFFKDQIEIPPQQQVDFGKRFGEFWHSDVSCDEEPPLGTMLQIHILPDCGVDTLFSESTRLRSFHLRDTTPVSTVGVIKNHCNFHPSELSNEY